MTARFPLMSFIAVALVDLCSVSSSRPSNRACGSPAHGLPTPFTAGIRFSRQGLSALGAITAPSRLSNPQKSADS